MDDQPELLGWLALLAYVVAWDVVAPRRGRITLSRSVWRALDKPIGGPFAVGLMAGIVHHFLWRPENARPERHP